MRSHRDHPRRHDPRDRAAVDDRDAIIHGGTIRAIGTLDELRERTGCHYLEDVFRSLVGADDAGVAAP